MIADLQAGTFGVRFRVPAGWTVVSDDDTLVLKHTDTGVQAWLFFEPDMRLDLQERHRDHLRAALELYARYLFADLFAQHHDGSAEPRTADAAWSPLIDVEHAACDGVPTLRTVHRMCYERGREIILGHLLLPLRDGLFELRVAAHDAVTGSREAALMLQGGGDSPLSQAQYDDPVHDTSFAAHALSRVRAALRTLAADGELRALAAPPAPPSGDEIDLPQLGCALVPPARFVQRPAGDGPRARFQRVSFCVSDGVEQFLVDAVGDQPTRNLRTLALEHTRKLHEGVGNLRLDAQPAGDHVLVFAEGLGQDGRLHNALRWFVDDRQRPWYVGITARDAMPASLLAAELEAAAHSWRAIGPVDDRGPPATPGRFRRWLEKLRSS